MITNLYLCFRGRIEKGCYLFDCMLQEYGKKSVMSEITLGTIVTRTMETGEIKYTYNFAEDFFNLFKNEKRVIIETWCSSAQEETKRLNDFFATNI